MKLVNTKICGNFAYRFPCFISCLQFQPLTGIYLENIDDFLAMRSHHVLQTDT